MKTTENNKLIADFMGERGNDTEDIKDIYTGIPVNGMKTITVEVNRMKFHTSWDWLMPVVEKIERMGYHVEIFSNQCVIVAEIEKTDSKRVTKYGKTRLSAVYKAVIDFINWHNQQKL